MPVLYESKYILYIRTLHIRINMYILFTGNQTKHSHESYIELIGISSISIPYRLLLK